MSDQPFDLVSNEPHTEPALIKWSPTRTADGELFIVGQHPLGLRVTVRWGRKSWCLDYHGARLVTECGFHDPISAMIVAEQRARESVETGS